MRKNVSDFISTVLIVLVLIRVALFTIIIQLNMFLWGEKNYEDIFLVGIIMVFFLLYYILNPKFRFNNSVTVFIFVFCLFILVECIRGWYLYSNLQVAFQIRKLVDEFLMFFIAFVICGLGHKIKMDKICEALAWYSVFNAIVCVIELLKNGTIFKYLYDENENPLFQSTFYGKYIRATGLLSSGYSCGLVLVFGLLFFLTRLLVEKKLKFVCLCGIVLHVVAIFATRTRNIYIFAAIAVILMLFFNYIVLPFYKNKYIFNILISSLILIFILVPLMIVWKIIREGTIINIAKGSMGVRIRSWARFLSEYGKRSGLEKLFGKGNVNLVYTDNAIMNVLLYVGIVGVVMYFIVYISILFYMIYKVNEKNYILIIVPYILAGFVLGMANYYEPVYYVFSLILPVIAIGNIDNFIDSDKRKLFIHKKIKFKWN